MSISPSGGIGITKLSRCCNHSAHHEDDPDAEEVDNNAWLLYESFSEDRSSFRSLSGEQSKVRTGLLKSRACVIGGASEQLDLDIEQRKWSMFGH